MGTTVTGAVTDPVCGLKVEPATAAGLSTWNGETYHFCSVSCKTKFDSDPAAYARNSGVSGAAGGNRHGLTQCAATDGSHHTRTTPDGEAERVDLPITGMTCAACASVNELLRFDQAARLRRTWAASRRALKLQQAPLRQPNRQVVRALDRLGEVVAAVRKLSCCSLLTIPSPVYALVPACAADAF